MEYETNQPGAWWQRLKDSPRTVSALIIILVVAAAIYAFSGNNNGTQPQPLVTPTPIVGPEGTQPLVEAIEQLPEEQEIEGGYIETASAGQGATHLARQAATRWLADHDAGYGVTNEHRIYIEDYIQKKLGSPRLEVGDSKTVSFDLIKEAVETAGKLSPKQLKNLTKYTHVL